MHEKENDAFGSGGEMGRMRFEWPGHGSGGRARENIGECERAKSDGALAERLAACHRIWKAMGHAG